MGLFRCEECGCVENTALGLWWSRNDASIWPAGHVCRALCSECAPSVFSDGKPSGYGVWHGRFAKRSADGMLIDDQGTLWSQDAVVPKSYRIVGKVEPDPT
jgi:hypothetical protein